MTTCQQPIVMIDTPFQLIIPCKIGIFKNIHRAQMPVSNLVFGPNQRIRFHIITPSSDVTWLLFL